MVGPDVVVNMGEITCRGFQRIDAKAIARRVVKKIGYDKPAEHFNRDTFEYVPHLHGQSPDIAQGGNRKSKAKQVAGDQDMMFGYATNGDAVVHARGNRLLARASQDVREAPEEREVPVAPSRLKEPALRRLRERQALLRAFRAAGRIAESMREKRHQKHFIREFDMYAAGRCNNWDHRWMFSVLDQRGICLIPCNNLVESIGFGPDSTFAANSTSYHAHRKTAPIPLPPKAPSSLEPNQRTDAAILDMSNGLSRFHIFLTRLLAPIAPQLIKIPWWFSRLKSR